MANSNTPETATSFKLKNWREEFQIEKLPAILLSGVIFGAVEVLIVISLAALMFSGKLSGWTSQGIGLWLMGGFIIGVINALTSSYRGVMTVPQDTGAIVNAVMAAAIASHIGLEGETLFFTVVAAMALSTLFTGIAFYLLGVFKLGSMTRFLPYPVIGGFLAGSGWLLVIGAFGVVTAVPDNLAGMTGLFDPAVLVRWAPPFVYGLAMVIILRRYHHHLILPTMLIASMALFYVLLAVSGVSFAEATAQNWFLSGGGAEIAWQPLTPAHLPQVEWEITWGQAGNMFTVFVTSLVGMLLNTSGMEVVARKPIDINQELKSAGMANIASGFVSGPVGYPAISLSSLSARMGIESRLMGVLAASMYGVALLFGAAFLAYFPTPVLAAMLFFFGFSFLADWMYDGWRKLTRADFGLVAIIMAIIAVFGFLEGVIVGLVFAVLIFAVNYSQVDIVANRLNGLTFRSNVDRRPKYRQILDDYGEQIYILRLRGYIFFGTANDLLQSIRERVTDADKMPVKYVALDFANVTALDSSALNSLTMLRQLAGSYDFKLALTDVKTDLQQKFAAAGFDLEKDERSKFFYDLDHGMEWCEDGILVERYSGEQTVAKRIGAAFEDVMGRAVDIDFDKLMQYFTTLEVEVGEALIEEGSPPAGLYFIEEGEVNAQLARPGDTPVRLRKIGSGSIVGEIQVYMDAPASASVVATKPSIVRYLPLEALAEMEKKDPQLASAFHKHIAIVLSSRLVENNAMIKAVMD